MSSVRSQRLPRLLAACVGLWLPCLDSHAAAPTRPTIETGDAIPRVPVSDRRCADRTPGATRWLDSNPHVPFFIGADGDIESAGQVCCAPWAVRDSRWRAIGRYGEVTGVARIAGGQGNDVTQCYALDLKMVSGAPGVGLFASEKGNWKSPAQSARWQPSLVETSGFQRLVTTIEALLDKPNWEPDPDAKPAPFGDRMVPFAIKPDPSRGERGGRFAAIGGRALILARLDEDGAWRLSYLDTSIAMGGGDGMSPLAAFDVDGDGIPELIYRWNAVDTWADAVLRLDYHGWVVVAESIGGSST